MSSYLTTEKYAHLGVDLLFEANYSERIPHVSIRMITYGHEKFIVQAVSSILEDESYTDYELIISDDASPDRTQEVLLDYLKSYKGRGQVLYFRHKENRYKNINPNFGHQALFKAMARGDLQLAMDGDDFSKPGRIRSTVEIWESLDPKPSMLIVNAERYIESTGMVDGCWAKEGDLYPPKGERCYYKPAKDIFTAKYPAFGSGSVMSRDFCDWCKNLSPAKGIIAGDALISRRAMMHKGIWFVNEPLFYYRVNEGSVSSGGNSGKKWIHDRLLRWYILEKDLSIISPSGKPTKEQHRKLKYWILRTKMAEYLIDCPHWIWPFAVIPYIFISWRAAVFALKLRIKLIMFGDVNASFRTKNLKG